MGGCKIGGKASTAANPCSPLNSRSFGSSIVGSGGGGGGGELPAPIQLTGNVGFPDPLGLWRLAANGNSGAVQANGTQAAGLYDTVSPIGTAAWQTARTRWGSCLAETTGARYTGVNLPNLRLMAEMSAAAYVFPTSVTAHAGRIIAMQGTVTDTSEAENALWAMYLQGSGEAGTNPRFAYFHHYHVAGVRNTALLVAPWRYAVGSEGFTCGFTRASDGRTVQLFINGIPVTVPTLLAAPPSGGGNSRLQQGCSLDAANVPNNLMGAKTGGQAVWSSELTADEMYTASLSISIT